MRNKQDPVEFVLEENPELEWDDIHDVRTVAELLGAMVEDLEEQLYDNKTTKTAEIAKAMNDLKTEQYENKTCTNNIDVETNHRYADNLLCDMLIELGYEDFVDDYRQIQKWYA